MTGPAHRDAPARHRGGHRGAPTRPAVPLRLVGLVAVVVVVLAALWLVQSTDQVSPGAQPEPSPASATSDLPTASASSPSSSASASPSPRPSATTLAAEPATESAANRSTPPTGLRLPDGLRVPVVAVGTLAGGALDVPPDIRTAGWWRGGAMLGDPFGSMVIAAHVDSRTQGLGAYAVLLTVKAGQTVTVSAGRREQTFAVTQRRVVSRTKLDSVPDVFSAKGPARLTMITCAGPYDKSRGGYQNLAIVSAEPVAAPTVSTGE